MHKYHYGITIVLYVKRKEKERKNNDRIQYG